MAALLERDDLLAELESARAEGGRLLFVGVRRGPRPSTRENAAGLTARELDVLPLLVQGFRNSKIAAHLYVSSRTVDHHVSAILRKLSARSRLEASAAALQLGLVETR